MLDLLTQINNNDQIYGRSFNKHINKRVKEVANDILGKDFGYSEYPHFLNAVE